jgi:beta-1,4-mannosyltransferase
VSTRVLGWPAFKPDTGNPYNGLLYGAIERRGARVDEFAVGKLLRGRYDVWHIHWPERIAHSGLAVVRLAVFAALVLLAKVRGTRIVWTVHNLEGHARRHPGLERSFMRWFAGKLDGVVCLSENGKAAVQERYPALRVRPAAVVPLGHYVGGYPNHVGPVAARLLLDISRRTRVIAFVGRIQPYKNVTALVEQFRALDDQDARLVIAGEPATEELERELVRTAEGDLRIRLFLQDVADEELQVFLNAADLVALPYERILNSGSALLSLSFGRPVLVPAGGAMEDLQAELGFDAVRVFDGPLTTAHLSAALDLPAPLPKTLIDRVQAARDWDAIADSTLSLYAEAAS